MAEPTLTGKTFRLTEGAGLKGTFFSGVLSGALIFGAIFGLLFGFTGLTILGFTGFFGVIAGIVLGLLIGASIGLLLSLTKSKDTGPVGRAIGRTAILAALGAIAVILIFGVSFWPLISGAIIGAAVGFFMSIALKEETADSINNIVISVAVIAILVWVVILWSNAGVFQLFFGPLGFSSERMMAGIEKGITCIQNPVDCFFKGFYDWSEPTITEKKEEEISVKVDFSNTKTVFFEEEKITVKTAIVVKTPLQPYRLEPKCFFEGEEMQLRDTPRVENGVIDFRKSDIEQSVSVICEKEGITLEGEKKEIKSFDFELHLVKNIIARAEWNVYTLHEDVLKRTENPFEGINEPNLRNRIVLSKMKFDSPLKLSIGSDNDQPFFETDKQWPFSVVLRKQDVPGELLGINNLILEDPMSNTISISDCEFEQAQDHYYLDYDKLDRAVEILNKQDAPIGILCNLAVKRLDETKQVPEKTIIKANMDFDFESIYKRPITIMSGIQREELE